jgi:hypothetical protein
MEVPDPHRRQILTVAGGLILTGMGASGPASAQSRAIEVQQLRLEREDDGLFLSAVLRFDLPPLVEDTLRRGVPVFFVAEAEVLRDRWYWSDQVVAASARYLRLAYQPLVRRWRLHVSPTPIGNGGLGVNLAQNYEELSDAMAAVQRFARWRIADLAQLDAQGRYTVDFGFRLDVSQLPRPFQIGIAGRADWSMAVERSLRLVPPEGS